MTVPPDQGRSPGAPGGAGGPGDGGPGADSPNDPQPALDFDPYRFGRPTHPVAPEYAPPGYWPPTEPTVPRHPYTPLPPPPPGHPAYGTPRTGNTKAVVALVLGILSIVFSWLSFFDLVFVVPAIVLGALGRRDAARYPERGGRSAATSGLICGIVGVLIAVVATVYLYNKIKPCLDKYGASSQAYQNCATDRIVGN